VIVIGDTAYESGVVREACDTDMKILMTNATELSVQEIVEIYSLRWQVELFLKELEFIAKPLETLVRKLAAQMPSKTGILCPIQNHFMIPATRVAQHQNWRYELLRCHNSWLVDKNPRRYFHGV